MATCFCHQNGRMECWPPARSAYGSGRILSIKAEINHSNCKKKLLSFNFVQDKLTHHSITPSFHYSNRGEAPKFLSMKYI